MLRSIRDLNGFAIRTLDGAHGRVHDFVLEDTTWMIRYMVAVVRSWPVRRRILIPCDLVDAPDDADRALPVQVTRGHVQNSPPLGPHDSRSGRLRSLLKGLGRCDLLCTDPLPFRPKQQRVLVHEPLAEENLGGDSSRSEKPGNPHLWPIRELVGYHLHAEDDQFGYVVDLIVDDREWSVCHVVIGMRRLPPGKKVLLSPDQIEGICWSGMHLDVSLSSGEIRSRPEFRNRPSRGRLDCP